ncbi:MAG: hypothetical protein ACOVS5_11310, partial [Oligoflexus sp.]
MTRVIWKDQDLKAGWTGEIQKPTTKRQASKVGQRLQFNVRTIGDAKEFKGLREARYKAERDIEAPEVFAVCECLIADSHRWTNCQKLNSARDANVITVAAYVEHPQVPTLGQRL